ncbi:MAG: GNAT family N-acetyltransferase [Treponema sp.]|jgi:predicted N-acetyltransferase YhbS|nr:GNAT family N-acetyltransferase [Treponema sp.]
MNIQYVTAKREDYDDLMDFGNYVFSHARSPVDFPSLLPKLYNRERFMEGIHYLAREDGKIRAAVGAYPLTMNILGDTLPGRGIGMVSVHPYARSRGYMKVLMETALKDMVRDGIVFSCLGGLRQRYEYFGFSPAGTRIVFECRRSNIRHTQGKDFSPSLSIRQVKEGEEELTAIYEFHQSKAARIERRRENFFDILSSWKNRVFVLTEGTGFAGYLVYSGADNTIPEINLIDPRRMAAAACFFNYLDKHNDRDQLSVCVQPWEHSKIESLSAFAEDYRISTAYSFAVFDWPLFLSALLKLKAGSGQTLPDGEACFRVAGGNESADSCFRIAVRRGEPRLDTGAEAGDAIVLDPLQAIRFFFSPLSPWDSPVLRKNPFLRGILPLPLFFEDPDGV